MRARMALHYAGIALEMREIELRSKPAHMRQISPKATVPVLLLPDGSVLEQSLDIMQWALQIRDSDGWRLAEPAQRETMAGLIASNDGSFKQALDRYKYAERFPEFSQQHYRTQGEAFLLQLEERLRAAPYLFGTALCMADIAIFPFIRQFAAVDSEWFAQAPYAGVRLWLAGLTQSALFTDVMKKYPIWRE